jgi:PAS domain S-box-containing protein
LSQRPFEPGTVKDLTLRVANDEGTLKELRFQAEIRWCEQTITSEFQVGVLVSTATPEDQAQFVAFLVQATAEAYREKENAIYELEGYRSLVELGADPILVVQDEKVVFSNQAATEMFGLTSEELARKKFQSLVFSGPHKDPMGSSAASSIERLRDSSVYYTLNGVNENKVEVEVRSRPILHRSRPATLSVLRDLNERNQMARAHVQRERLKMLGELSGGVIHDVNQSLVSILGAAELIALDCKDGKIATYLKTIQESAYESAKSLHCLHGFGRLSAPRHFLLFDVNDVIADAEHMAFCQDEEDGSAGEISLSVTTEDDGLIQGDPSEVRQALVHLIVNAVDAMPHGGEIEVASEVDEDTVSICVRDSGTGIPEDIQNQIFDPFFTTKNAGASGLGLSAVYGVVARHNGSVKVQSVEGEGTKVCVQFPRAFGIPTKEMDDLEIPPDDRDDD